MSIKLLNTLIRTTLATTEIDWIPQAKQQIASATELEWQQTISALAVHRLLPLVSYALKIHDLTETVPQAYLAPMQAAYHQTRVQNTLLLLTLDGILKAMEKRGLHPVLWKGVVLADSFYPDLGTRAMGDIDFAVPASEMEEVSAAFKSLGFTRQQPEYEDAVYFANPMGVVCDVHRRVRLFEGKESMNLTTDLQTQHMKAPALPVLEPNAMLVHLSVHLDGHLPETGPMLCWILDMAFVMRKWGTLLELERIEQLMPTRKNLISLFRTIRFLEHEFGEKPPECLAEAIEDFKPFTLADVLRQRRLALWGLPSLRGWLRLAANQLGFQLKGQYPNLQARDLLFPFLLYCIVMPVTW